MIPRKSLSFLSHEQPSVLLLPCDIYSRSQATMPEFCSRSRAKHFKLDFSNPALFPRCCYLAPGILIDQLKLIVVIIT
ncbi:hypothetical protein M413DRAFT_375296 [Hebeloma cylindrosporum]|uniref:Uncharacterized protein n=1 Tax=Hebeloma cylindrosporum TaxID=76867 RepID=A0A0C3CK61_HEBCY|nr:hypothetical protein M413DRAFT_375296 [Hebeloma cylindrosporum h7]